MEDDDLETEPAEIPVFLDLDGDETYVWTDGDGSVLVELYESQGFCEMGEEHHRCAQMNFDPGMARRVAAALLNAADAADLEMAE